jgi:D-alanyl-D-alanine carboxypeptidase
VSRRASTLLVGSFIVSACGGAIVAPSSPPPSSPLATPTASATVEPTSAPTTAPTATATATPTRTPASTATPGPAPSGPVAYCRVGDQLTPNQDFAEHTRTYLDWTYALRDSYIPPDLVSATSGAQLRITPFAVEAIGAAEVLARRGDPAYSTLLTDAPNSAIRSLVFPDLAAMRTAATATGIQLVILSSYRSYSLQAATFDYWVRVGGYEQALRTSARPGHSEHQLGTAIDFGDGQAAPWEYADWATTPAGAWLAAHAAEYGFVMSFPKGKTGVTCYDYEPWHYRWVGRSLAQTISESRVTLREYQSVTLR